MFAADRLDAMDILRRYSDDHENSQRIVFSVMQVKLKKRKNSITLKQSHVENNRETGCFLDVKCTFWRIFQESFSAAKLAFSSFKLKVRSNLVTTHVGPDTLEEHVQDYINRNTDLYDLAGLVSVSKLGYIHV